MGAFKRNMKSKKVSPSTTLLPADDPHEPYLPFAEVPAASPGEHTVLVLYRILGSVLHRVTFVFAVLAVAGLVIGIAATVSGHFRLVPVLGNSMQPTFSRGDVAIVERVPSSRVRVGSVIVADPPKEYGGAVIHRVVRVDSNGETVKTKGDANATADVWNTSLVEKHTWLKRWTIPQLATVMWKLQHGVLPIVIAAVLIPAFILTCLQRIWQIDLKYMLRCRLLSRMRQNISSVDGSESAESKPRRRLVAVFALLVLLMQGSANGLFTGNASATGGAVSSASIVSAAPTSPTCAFSGDNNIVMSWTANASTIIDGYDVQRSATTGGPYASIGTTAGGASSSGGPFAFSGPLSSHFVVRAKRNNWRSDAATPELPSVSCPRTLSTYVGPPSSLANTATGGQFRGITTIGNTLYFADSDHDVIWAMNRTTNAVTVAAGSFTEAFANGAANVAAFADPISLSADAVANVLYIADAGNQRIRKLDLNTNTVSTAAGTGTASFSGDGGQATAATISSPSDTFLDGNGNLFIADTGNHRIRKIVLSTGVISTVAGNGTAGSSGDGGQATSANLNSPKGVYALLDGTTYIADTANNKIRVVNISGVISTVVGTGTASSTGDGGNSTLATINAPTDVDFDGGGNGYLVESNGHRVRMVVPSTGIISTLTGSSSGFSDGALASAKFRTPYSLHFAANGDLYLTDWGNYRIRVVLSGSSSVATAAGYGGIGECCGNTSAAATLTSNPRHMAFDSSGNMYFTEYGVIRKVATDGTASVYAGNGVRTFAGDGGTATSASVNLPSQLVFDSANNLYFADTSNDRVRKIDWSTKVITTIAGTGTGSFTGDGGLATAATVSSPRGIAVDALGNVFVADAGNNRIRKINASDGKINTIYGDGSATVLNGPYAIKLMNGESELLISDTSNHRVLRLNLSTLNVTTIAGTGVSGTTGDGGIATEAKISSPRGLDVDSAGNIYIAGANNRIRVIAASTGKIYMIVGGNGAGTTGDGVLGTASTAKLSQAYDVAVNSTTGDFYVSDSSSHRIRKLTR